MESIRKKLFNLIPKYAAGVNYIVNLNPISDRKMGETFQILLLRNVTCNYIDMSSDQTPRYHLSPEESVNYGQANQQTTKGCVCFPYTVIFLRLKVETCWQGWTADKEINK